MLRSREASPFMRWVARRLVWLSGQLARVKTRQKTWRLISVEPWQLADEPEYRWSSCQLSYRVLTVAMHMDWDHWPHWGLVHEGCLERPHVLCETCGGVACDWDDEEDE